MTAEWQPDCLSFGNEFDLDALNGPVLAGLKTAIVEYLKSSWCSDQKATLLLDLVVLTRPAVCVEVGAFTGSCTLPMLAGLRHLGAGRAYVIDAWSNEEAIRGLPADDANTIWWSSLDMVAVREQFSGMLDHWALGSFCDVRPESSRQALGALPALDFLHLDGNFSEEGARLDSELYLPKVAPRGYVLLSNVLVTVGGLPTKMKALRPLFDACEIIAELDGGNTLLFRKR